MKHTVKGSYGRSKTHVRFVCAGFCTNSHVTMSHAVFSLASRMIATLATAAMHMGASMVTERWSLHDRKIPAPRLA